MIDEQGRLFGKINLIDLAVILIAVVLIAGFLYRDRAAGTDSEGRTVILTVVAPGKYPGVSDNLKVGDQLVANGALTSARITSIEVKPANWVASNAEGKMVLSANPFRKDIFLTIEGQSTQVTPAEITLAGQKVRAGKEDFVVKTQKVEMDDCIITKLEVK